MKNNDVEYYIDGVNFKDFGVYVSSSTGIVGRLAQKENLNADFSDYHGIVRDLQNRRYKERTITLQCFIEAQGRIALIEQAMSFCSMFDGVGTHRLKIELDGEDKPLVYEVNVDDATDITKTWGSSPSELIVGSFSLKLVEDEPVKRVLRFTANTKNNKVSVSVTSRRYINIYWGDGTHTFNIAGNFATVEHEYERPGVYEIILSGVIEEITEFSTNAEIVWQLLK